MSQRDRNSPPDTFLREPVEAYVRPVLQDLAQQLEEAPRIPATLIEALAPRYTITRALGRGGMASVYLASDQSLGRHVAVKVLQPEVSDALSAERFTREIEVTAQLHHSRIVPVHDRGEAAGLLYYIMPHFAGGSLRQRLDRQGPLSISDAIAIAKDVAHALDYAHAHGVVHRDIKPENILLEDEGAFVADFGVARLVEAADKKRLTQTGIAIGTPYYMSPEQADPFAAIDGRSDVYALGCVMYEMLAGEPPFTGPDRRAVLAKHAAAPTPNLTVIRDTVTPAMQSVIARALSKTPADRYLTAGAFAEALQRVAMIGPSLRVSAVPRALAIAAALVLVAATGIGLYTWRSTTTSVLDPDKLVIAPLTLQDSSLAVWRMGTVDWLSRTLDGAGPIRTVPASAIDRWSHTRRLSAIELARALGAGLVVDGSLMRAGADSIRLLLTLRDARKNQILSETSVTDEESRIDRLMDSATVGLLHGLPGSDSRGRLVHANIGSHSLLAIKAFLRGEELYRRMELPSARTAYEEALQLDNNFPTAAHKLFLTIGYLKLGRDTLALVPLRRAIANNQHLGPRDSLLIVVDSILALSPLNNQTSQRLVEILRQLARRYDDDAEIWNTLANVMEGRSITAWSPPIVTTPGSLRHLFDRAIALDSSNADAWGSSAQLSISMADTATALLRSRKCRDAARFGFGRASCELFLSFLIQPNAAATLALLDTASSWAQFEAVIAFAELPDENETGVTIARRLARIAADDDREALFDNRVEAARVLAARGHLREAWPYATGEESRLESDQGVAGQIAALGGVASDSIQRVLTRYGFTLDQLERWGAMWWILERNDTTVLRRLFVLADSVARRGDPNSPLRAPYYRAIARAQLTLARADTSTALRLLLTLPDTMCGVCLLHRYAATRLLSSYSRLDKPPAWLQQTPSLVDVGGPIVVAWRLDRARLAERLGNGSQAIEDYWYVAHMWQHADSVLQPYVTEARHALQRLRSDR